MRYLTHALRCYLLLPTLVLADDSLLRLATTTSTENSGLLAVLNPPFESKYGIKVHVLAFGTGKALQLGENGDVDLLLVHAPLAEKAFIASGYGIDRTAVMYNDFILLGPNQDPANVRAVKTIIDAFNLIADNESYFVSRGDDSGTHKKELAIWNKSQFTPTTDNEWYWSVGQGMGASLNIADNKRTYILSDRGTYLAYRENLKLVILFEKGDMLHNPYHIIAVNPAKHAGVNYSLAKKYLEYVTSVEGQRIIKNLRINGEQLFYPNAIP